MTDLKITRLCAAAMGYKFTRRNPFELTGILVNGIVDDESRYDPLHDDAQAMALVKKFRLRVEREPWLDPPWRVAHYAAKTGWMEVENDDLNRAICECVAERQAAK